MKKIKVLILDVKRECKYEIIWTDVKNNNRKCMKVFFRYKVKCDFCMFKIITYWYQGEYMVLLKLVKPATLLSHNTKKHKSLQYWICQMCELPAHLIIMKLGVVSYYPTLHFCIIVNILWYCSAFLCIEHGKGFAI